MAVVAGKTYHEVSTVQEGWGLQLMEKIPAALTKTTTVIIDAACGTGRLTEPLAKRFPLAHIYAVDKSPEMLTTAKQHLNAFTSQITFMEADLENFSVPQAAQIIYCNSAYHWVENQRQLMHNFFGLLSPGGSLFLAGAEKNNLQRCRGYASKLVDEAPFAADLKGWLADSYPNDRQGMETNLRDAGFTDITIELMHYDHPFVDRQTFMKFASSTFLNSYLVHLHDAALQKKFIETFMARYEADHANYFLDVSRLVVTAQKSL